MSVVDQFLKKMKVNVDDEDYDDEDEFEEENEAPKKSFFKPRQQVDEPEDFDDYDEPDESDEEERNVFKKKAKKPAMTQPQPVAQKKIGRIVNMKQTQQGTNLAEVAVIVPKEYEDASDCVDLLKEGKAVLLNLEGLNLDHAQRVIDFMSGASYALGANFQKVSVYLFIASPGEVTLSGDLLEDLGSGFSTPSFDINV